MPCLVTKKLFILPLRLYSSNSDNLIANRELDHPYILKIATLLPELQKIRVNFATDVTNDLSKVIPTIKDAKLKWTLAHQIVDSLAYLSGKGVVHGNIKPKSFNVREFFNMENLTYFFR